MSRIASVFLNSGMFPAVPHASEVGENGEVSQEYWSRLFKNDGAKASDSLAAVYGCVNVISSSISAMPLQLFRKGPGGREREANHPVAKLLATWPNEAMTWTQLRESIIYNTVLRGNSYARTFWRGGYPVEIFPVPTASVTPKLSESRAVVYQVSANDKYLPNGHFRRPEIAHFKALTSDGLLGINPIEHCRLTLGSAMALSRYGKESAEEGGPIRGVITMETAFKNPQQAAEVRSRWGKGFESARRGQGVAIFEGGNAKFQPITMSMRDAQFLESMQFSVEEICRIFNVPPHKIQKLDRATFSNIEHQSLEFYTSCLVPWIVRLEATFDECLLTDSDRAVGLYFRHNADGLLRGDMAGRVSAMKELIQSSALTPNEARALEERPPLEGGDELLCPVNYTHLSKIKSPITTP